MRRIWSCICLAAVFAIALGSAVTQAETNTVAIEGNWQDLAGKFGWDSKMEVSEDMGTFSGPLPGGIDVRGTREGEQVTAILKASGKQIGQFVGTIDGDKVHGSYTVAGEETPVGGEASWKIK